MGIRSFTLGFVLAMCISACAGVKFLYKYYVFDYEAQVLRGPEPKDDLKSNICQITNGEYQCMVMKIGEFYRLKSDYLKMGNRLEELERKCGN
jgi:hypothetical protein